MPDPSTPQGMLLRPAETETDLPAKQRQALLDQLSQLLSVAYVSASRQLISEPNRLKSEIQLFLAPDAISAISADASIKAEFSKLASSLPGSGLHSISEKDGQYYLAVERLPQQNQSDVVRYVHLSERQELHVNLEGIREIAGNNSEAAAKLIGQAVQDAFEVPSLSSEYLGSLLTVLENPKATFAVLVYTGGHLSLKHEENSLEEAGMPAELGMDYGVKVGPNPSKPAREKAEPQKSKDAGEMEKVQGKSEFGKPGIKFSPIDEGGTVARADNTNASNAIRSAPSAGTQEHDRKAAENRMVFASMGTYAALNGAKLALETKDYAEMAKHLKNCKSELEGNPGLFRKITGEIGINARELGMLVEFAGIANGMASASGQEMEGRLALAQKKLGALDAKTQLAAEFIFGVQGFEELKGAMLGRKDEAGQVQFPPLPALPQELDSHAQATVAFGYGTIKNAAHELSQFEGAKLSLKEKGEILSKYVFEDTSRLDGRELDAAASSLKKTAEAFAARYASATDAASWVEASNAALEFMVPGVSKGKIDISALDSHGNKAYESPDLLKQNSLGGIWLEFANAAERRYSRSFEAAGKSLTSYSIDYTAKILDLKKSDSMYQTLAEASAQMARGYLGLKLAPSWNYRPEATLRQAGSTPQENLQGAYVVHEHHPKYLFVQSASKTWDGSIAWQKFGGGEEPVVNRTIPYNTGMQRLAKYVKSCQEKLGSSFEEFEKSREVSEKGGLHHQFKVKARQYIKEYGMLALDVAAIGVSFTPAAPLAAAYFVGSGIYSVASGISEMAQEGVTAGNVSETLMGGAMALSFFRAMKLADGLRALSAPGRAAARGLARLEGSEAFEKIQEYALKSMEGVLVYEAGKFAYELGVEGHVHGETAVMLGTIAAALIAHKKMRHPEKPLTKAEMRQMCEAVFRDQKISSACDAIVKAKAEKRGMLHEATVDAAKIQALDRKIAKLGKEVEARTDKINQGQLRAYGKGKFRETELKREATEEAGVVVRAETRGAKAEGRAAEKELRHPQEREMKTAGRPVEVEKKGFEKARDEFTHAVGQTLGEIRLSPQLAGAFASVLGGFAATLMDEKVGPDKLAGEIGTFYGKMAEITEKKGTDNIRLDLADSPGAIEALKEMNLKAYEVVGYSTNALAQQDANDNRIRFENASGT